jgi:hypothetical protein
MDVELNERKRETERERGRETEREGERERKKHATVGTKNFFTIV